MSSYLTSKCAGLLSNIPSKQTALWTADINLSKCCEKVFGLGAAKSREERKRGQISQLEFSFVFTSKASLRRFAAWASQTCSPHPPSSSHAPEICPTHMHSIYTERFWGFFVSKHLPSVVCVESEHGPLSACWRCSSVWRRRCPSRKPPAASRDPQQPGWAEEETEKDDTWDTGLLFSN